MAASDSPSTTEPPQRPGSEGAGSGSTGTGPTGSVARAFRVLEEVVSSDVALGVRELGRRTELPKSSVARVLAELDRLGMVARTADGRALPGPALGRLQPRSGKPAPDLLVRLQPILEQLVATHGENAALSLDDGDRVLYVADVASEGPVQVPVTPGQRFPFHVVAPGLVLMAAWPDERVERYIGAGLETPTDHSITTAEELWSRLRYVRRRGYAWTDQELDLEVNGAAVPVHDDDGRVVAAVSLYGPAYRLSESLPGSMIIVDSLRSAVS